MSLYIHIYDKVHICTHMYTHAHIYTQCIHICDSELERALQDNMTPKSGEESQYSGSDDASADSSMRRAAAASRAKRSLRRSPSRRKAARDRSSGRARSAGRGRSPKRARSPCAPAQAEATTADSARGRSQAKSERPAEPENSPEPSTSGPGGAGKNAKQQKVRCRFCWKWLDGSPAARDQHEFGNAACIAWQLFSRMTKEEQNTAGWNKAQRNARLLKQQRDKEKYPEEREPRGSSCKQKKPAKGPAEKKEPSPSPAPSARSAATSRSKKKRLPPSPSPAPVRLKRRPRSPSPDADGDGAAGHRHPRRGSQQVIINMRW